MSSTPDRTLDRTSGPAARTVALAALVALLLAGVAATELVRYLQGQQLAYDALRTGFVLVSALGSLALAAALLVAPATRWPGAACAVSLLGQALVLGYRQLRTPGDLGPHGVVWIAAFALTPVLVDLVVLAYAGRPLPLAPLLLAALGVTVLCVVLDVAQQVDYVGRALALVGDPGFWIAQVVVLPVLLLSAVAVGRLVGLSRSA